MTRDRNDPWDEESGHVEAEDASADAWDLAPPVPATELIGTPVVDRCQQVLGRLVDVMIDAPGGVIAYGVVAVQGEGGDKRFAAPWSTLTHCRDRSLIVWNVERQALRLAPGLPETGPEVATPWLQDRRSLMA